MAADIGRMTGMSERMDAKDWVKVKGHLKDVYSLLAGACILGTVGAILEMQYAYAMPFLHTVALILTLAGVFGVTGLFGMKYRKPSFAALAFGMGFGLGPLLDHAAALNPSVSVSRKFSMPSFNLICSFLAVWKCNFNRSSSMLSRVRLRFFLPLPFPR